MLSLIQFSMDLLNDWNLNRVGWNGRTRRVYATALLLVVSAIVCGHGDIDVVAESYGLSRQEIQSFFVQDGGNSIRSHDWLNRYHQKPVDWKGKVYKVKDIPGSHRVEILVKVLPDCLLYDTVVVLEGNTRLREPLQPDQAIQFRGKIIHGVDVMGVKQVKILAPSPDSIIVR